MACTWTEKIRKKIEEYKTRLSNSLLDQVVCLRVIYALFEQQGKCIQIDNESHILRIIKRPDLSQHDLHEEWKKKYIQSFINSPLTNKPIGLSTQKMILLMRTSVTCTSTMFSFVKLALPYIAVGIGVNVKTPIWILSVLLILSFYSIPLASAQYNFDQRDEKYNNELKNLKDKIFAISKNKMDTLLDISSALFPKTSKVTDSKDNQTPPASPRTVDTSQQENIRSQLSL